MKKILALVLALCMVFALCACGSTASTTAATESTTTEAAASTDTAASTETAASDVTADLTVGTGGESGTYYAFTGVIATVVKQNSGINLTVVSTGGSKDNLVNMAEGVYDMGTVQSDVMTYAYNGTNTFAESGALTDFRVVCGLYSEAIQIVTTDPDIKTPADLKGKSVCVGDVGSGTYYNTIDILNAYGLTLDDITPVYQSFGDSTESIQDGKIDAAFVSAGAPTPAVATLASSKQTYLVSIDEEHMQTLLEECPWYAELTIPADTYTGVAEATTVTVKATLVCNKSISDDVIYTLVKTIFDNSSAIAELHAKGEQLSLEFATEGIAVPFAKGAAQYFAENGITVETVD